MLVLYKMRVGLLTQLCFFGAAARELALRHAELHRQAPRLPAGSASSPPLKATGNPGVPNCTLNWFTQTIDHFSFAATPTGATTYQQRYYTYANYWKQDNTGAIFFYAGNEADVTLYVDHTGLMWENAAQFNALLVFAEHRYYGESLPFGAASDLFYSYMTHEQAAADYATLVAALQAQFGVSQPVIVFGGSYGGMLAAWSRIKYPGTFAGAVAASAPVAAFNGVSPPFVNSTYWSVVTADAQAVHGAAPACAANVRAGFSAIYAAAQTSAGLVNLSATFKLCAPLASAAAADAFAVTLQLNAWDTLAMGNYPYPSNYLTGGGPLLPAWPVRAACEYLQDPGLATGDPWALLAAMEAASSVFNNATQDIACYVVPTDYWLDGIWDYQWCTEMVPEESYFTTNGVTDMFEPRVFDLGYIAGHCEATWGVTPRPNWISVAYGNPAGWGAAGVKNIVFSNGLYDPWSSGGITANISADLPAIVIPEGAHHIDTFFTDPLDPQSVTDARLAEMEHVKKWITEWYASDRS